MFYIVCTQDSCLRLQKLNKEFLWEFLGEGHSFLAQERITPSKKQMQTLGMQDPFIQGVALLARQASQLIFELGSDWSLS